MDQFWGGASKVQSLSRLQLAAGRIVRALPDHRVAGGATYLVHPPAKPLCPKLVAFCSYLLEHAPRLIGPPRLGRFLGHRNDALSLY